MDVRPHRLIRVNAVGQIPAESTLRKISSLCLQQYVGLQLYSIVPSFVLDMP